MRSNICLFILLGLTYTLPAHAQENNQKWLKAYLITNSKDTLKGEVRYNWDVNPLKELVFKQNNQEKTYLPFDIEAFGFADGTEFFQSVSFEAEKRTSKDLQIVENGNLTLETKKGFAQLILKGNLSLYSYYDNYRTYFLMQKTGEDITVLRHYKYYTFNPQKEKVLINAEHYKNQLNDVFAETPRTAQLTQKTPYQYSNLVYLFKTYHQEIGEKYKKIGLSNPIHVGLLGGLTFNKISFSEITTDEIHLVEFPTYTTPTFGIALEAYTNVRRKKFSFYLDLAWTGFKTDESLKSRADVQAGAAPSLVRTWHYKFNIQHLKATFLLRYNINTSQGLLFLSLGAGRGSAIKQDQQTYYTTSSGNPAYSKFSINGKTAFVGGLGFKAKKLSFETRFEGNRYKIFNYAYAQGSQIAIIGTYWFN